ncbi:MAG: NAD(P)/FAD-dependent oxidoreductase [Geobacter sp.]|nr:MAG: NAD(P)/FAD-dependent oxidoreductase [Geobacter sp.]
MESCDVLVVGGGPAGSVCAGKLRQAGLDVLLLDRETFPREKPCAGWITPAALATLELDPDLYRKGRVLQDVSTFRVGLVGGTEVVIPYGKTVSYGIRRREFDHYLLERSGVRRSLGEPVMSLEREEGRWLVNGRIRARLLVGAGGHYCPVARHLGAKIGREAVIAAQAAEFAMTPEQEQQCPIPAGTPALFFCRDMKGYGWFFRKGDYLNIGLGRMDKDNLGHHVREFCLFLQRRGYLAEGFPGTFQGHAYLLYQRQGGRRCVDDGVMLIGDAAGLSHPQSGEGILPAIESALLAADTIVEAGGDYRRDKLELYASRLAARFGGGGDMPSSPLVSGIARFCGARLLSGSWFVRHIVLDRWFLHADRKGLYAMR